MGANSLPVVADALPPTRDPYAIFMRARSAITMAQQRAPLIEYTISVSGFDGTGLRTNHYRASYRPEVNEIDVDAISLEESREAPPVIRDFDVRPQQAGCECQPDDGGPLSVSVGNPDRSPDLLGVPRLTPTYMFGLDAPAVSNHLGHALSSGPRVIAVVSTELNYAVTLVDEPAIDESPTYHLRLTPLRDPKGLRLRELWIGALDYLPRRAVIEGNFTTAPLTDVPWIIDFSVMNGEPVIVRETAAALFLPHQQVVRDVVVAFEDIGERRRLSGAPLIDPVLADPALLEPTL